MLLFYVRHGDPIYIPDSLTPLGQRQAEAVGKRLALYGIDEIYASTSQRAISTAEPCAQIMKKEITTLDFANENHAWRELTVIGDNGERTWLFSDKKINALFNTEQMQALRFKWYEHPEIKSGNYKLGIERIKREGDAFLRTLGYEHEGTSGRYKILKSSEKRVALFAHAGFGLAFLSTLLDIPYPMFSTHFDVCHTGLTVIKFEERDGYAYPKVLTLSSDSHLYREGLPTRYNNEIAF